MKVRILKEFRDKHTGERYEPEAVIDITEGRMEEISKVGKFVEPIKEPEDKRRTKKK